MNKKKGNRVVYSTNPDFSFEEETEEIESLEPNEQNLYVSVDRKNRGGKEVTIVEGYVGSVEEIKDLAKVLKGRCGVGGSVKNNEILIQGNFKDKIFDVLVGLDYRVKKKGGN